MFLMNSMRRPFILILGIVLLGIITHWPVQTRVGVDYEWSERPILFYEKVTNFFSRHFQTKYLVSNLLEEVDYPEDQVQLLFAWSRDHIRSTPPGFPVVDDHVWHIIVRGYGATDQRTEAFALLASYAGYPATVGVMRIPGTASGLIVALVKIDQLVHVFDVERGIVFLDEDGQLIDAARLATAPEVVRSITNGVEIAGRSYEHYVPSLLNLDLTFNRMELQKPWPRLKYETFQFVGRIFEVTGQ
jgi:hypothetical protein